jgi:tetratricopeptide (TPR) repeat protein
MNRMKIFSLYLLLFFFSGALTGQVVNQAKNEKLINAALEKFNDPLSADPIVSDKIVKDLLLIRKNCDVKQQQIIDLISCEQKSRQGDIAGLIIGMEVLVKQNPSFNDPTLRHFFVLNTTKIWLYKNDLNKASSYNLINISESKKSNINRNISQAYQSRALLFLIRNMKDSSIYYSKLSTKFAKRSDSRIELALSFHNESIIQSHFGDIELAVEKELLALQLAEKLNLYYFESLFNRTISNYSLEVKNIKESYSYLAKAMSLAKRLKDERSIALCEISQGGILINDSKCVEAIVLLKKAIKKLEGFKDALQIGQGYEYLGKAYEKTNREAEALNSFNIALKHFQNIGNRDKIGDIFHNIGVVYFKQKSYKKAFELLYKSIEIRTQEKEKNKLYDTYRVLSDLYGKTGNKDSSYLYLSKYVTFLELNSTSKNAQKIASLTQKNSGEQRERLLEMQGETLERELKEKKILQLQSDRRFYGIIFIIVILLLGVFIVFIVLRQIQLKQEQRVTEMSQTLLRSQMNPHFIFNAMSVIQSYIYENTPELASKFLVNFSRLMRLILENSSKEFIPLETEEEILTKYLNTQKLRFENRFEFKINIEEDLRLKRVLIPPMITQPFIENAIEHGQLHTIDHGIITVDMTQNDDLLEISISDNGVGRTKAGKIKRNKNHKSMAIDITRERIEILNKKYKGKGFLNIGDFDRAKKTGTHVTICLPIIYEMTTFNHEEKSSHN